MPKEKLFEKKFNVEPQKSYFFQTIITRQDLFKEKLDQKLFVSLICHKKNGGVIFEKASNTLTSLKKTEHLYLQENKRYLPCVFSSPEIKFPSSSYYVKAKLFIEQDYYLKVEVNDLILSQKTNNPKLHSALTSCEYWEKLATAEKKSKKDNKRLYVIFKTYCQLGKIKEACRVAKTLVHKDISSNNLESLEIRNFLDEQNFLQEEFHLPKRAYLRKEIKNTSTHKKNIVYLQNSENKIEINNLSFDNNHNNVIIKTLGVSQINQSPKIIAHEIKETYTVYSKPFVSHETLGLVPITKRLELDFNLSLSVLRKYHSPEIYLFYNKQDLFTLQLAVLLAKSCHLMLTLKLDQRYKNPTREEAQNQEELDLEAQKAKKEQELFQQVTRVKDKSSTDELYLNSRELTQKILTL